MVVEIELLDATSEDLAADCLLLLCHIIIASSPAVRAEY